MLTTTNIKENLAEIKQALTKRNFNEERLTILDRILEKDQERKDLQTELEKYLSDINKLSKDIGQFFKSGNADAANDAKNEVAKIKETSNELSEKHKNVLVDLEDMLLQVPNVPHESVPTGTTEDDNEVYQDWKGDMPELHAGAKPHWELAEELDIIDFKTGVLVTGAGFPLFKGQGARLQRALINFFLDEAQEAGYLEVVPPLLVNEESAKGTGNLPDKEGQMYHAEKDNLYLIPTAEIPLTNMYRGQILDHTDFPIKLTGYTPCFRREAGSYGSDVKGLNRVHQFDKIEIVQLQHPDKSFETQLRMLDHVSGLLEKLELPFRILRLCGGDLTFASALTFDFEVYSAAQKKWLEVSSVSNFETYQSNRLKLRYKDENGKKHLAHTLNGSALALARIIAAMMENHQTPEGIKIPEALRSYTGFDYIK